VNQEVGRAKRKEAGEGMEKGKEWVPLLGRDLRGRRQREVGALKGELD
jgi:hypothetical protein